MVIFCHKPYNILHDPLHDELYKNNHHLFRYRLLHDNHHDISNLMQTDGKQRYDQ